MTYTIKISPDAATDIIESSNYISNILQAPESAQNLSQKLKSVINSLDIMPNRFPIVDKEPWKSRKIHRVNVGSYCIYYRVDENTKIVWISTVVYAKRDQTNILNKISNAR